MISRDQIKASSLDFIRAQSNFANVIQEMEAELKRMRDNDRVPQDVINKKDDQIETLIAYNNKIDDLFNLYKLATLNLQVELMATNELLWQALKSNDSAFTVLMHHIKPKRNPLENTQHEA